MDKKQLYIGQRTFNRIQEHYEIEKKLAHKLLHASAQERRILYSSVYEELYSSVPDHPQLIRKSLPAKRLESIEASMKLLRSFLNKNTDYLEIGPGDCGLAFEVSKIAKTVCAIDVSETITYVSDPPDNFKLIISDGTSINLPRGTIDVAYSHHLMEHLHPDDSFQQLTNIYNCLSIGGIYICETPNRLSGPHDISKYFDSIATGFHLKEYTFHELSRLFKSVGFRSIKPIIRIKGVYINSNYIAFISEGITSIMRYIGGISIMKSRLGEALLPNGIIASK